MGALFAMLFFLAIPVVLWAMVIGGGFFLGTMFETLISASHKARDIYRVALWVMISVAGLALGAEYMTRAHSPRSLGSYINFFYGMWLFIAVVMFVLIIIRAIRNNNETGRQQNFNRIQIGVLVIMTVVLFSNANLYGWIRPGTTADEPRYTADGRFRYHVEFERRSTGFRVTLVAVDANSGRTHSFNFSSCSRGPEETPWLVLSPVTGSDNVYTATIMHPSMGMYPQYTINFSTGRRYAQYIENPDELVAGVTKTTDCGRLEYRLEMPRMIRGRWRHDLTRLSVHNLETGEAHSIPLFTRITDTTRTYTIYAPYGGVDLTPTDSTHVYIAVLGNRFDVFYVCLSRNISERIDQYFHGPWHTSENSRLEYRMRVSGLHLDFSLEHSAFVEIRCVVTQDEMVIDLPADRNALRRHIIASSDLDWVTLASADAEGQYHAELRIPRTAPHDRTLNANIDINFVDRNFQVTWVP